MEHNILEATPAQTPIKVTDTQKSPTLVATKEVPTEIKKRRAGNHSEAPTDKKPKPADSEKKKRIADQRKAYLLKDRYLKATAVHSGIVRNIKNDSRYTWANNENQLGRLTDVANALEKSLQQHPFNTFWVLNDQASVKAKYTELDLQNHLVKFMDLEGAVSTMEKEHSRFNRMHNAQVD